MNRIFVHIYYGTAGNAGLYIKEIIDAQKDNKIEVRCIVNYYFPFEGKEYEKIFFKYSEKMKTGKLRKLFRFLELYSGFIKSIRIIKNLSKRYDTIYINYSLNESYLINLRFLRAVKAMKNVILGITVHDVIPFHSAKPKWLIRDQGEFLSLADFFLVHNEFSLEELRRRFSSKTDRIFMYRFPLMDLNMIYQENIIRDNVNNRVTFLFIGYLRKEKGVDLLINAWRSIQEKYRNARLVVAGRIPEGIKYDFSGMENFELHDRFLNDKDFYEYINASDYVVLPYTLGTNSGILSTTSSLGKPAITSNLRVFTESHFVIKELMFRTGDEDSLRTLLENVIRNHEAQYASLCMKVERNLTYYREMFGKEVNQALTSILQIRRS